MPPMPKPPGTAQLKGEPAASVRLREQGLSRACPGWLLSGTFDFTEGDWDMISKIRARPPVRLNELYTATYGPAALSTTKLRP